MRVLPVTKPIDNSHKRFSHTPVADYQPKMSSSFFIKSLVKGWVEKAGGKPSSFFKTFATQNQNTKTTSSPTTSTSSSPHSVSPRTLVDLSDSQIAHLLQAGTISPHRLEADLGDPVRAVSFSSSFFFFSQVLASTSC